MEYSAEFDREIEAIEETAIRLADAESGQRTGDDERNLFVAQLDHVLNTYPVSCDAVVRHIEEVKRIRRTRDHWSTASKHVATVHEAFLADICDDYRPTY